MLPRHGNGANRTDVSGEQTPAVLTGHRRWLCLPWAAAVDPAEEAGARCWRRTECGHGRDFPAPSTREGGEVRSRLHHHGTAPVVRSYGLVPPVGSVRQRHMIMIRLMSRDRENSVEKLRDAAELLGCRLVSSRRWHRRTPRLGRAKPQSPRRRSRAGSLFVGGYAVLLGVIGLSPAGYALNLAVTTFDGAFNGLANFTDSSTSLPGPGVRARRRVHVGLADGVDRGGHRPVAVHAHPRTAGQRGLPFHVLRAGGVRRSASVLLWLFMLQPGLSPWDFVLHALGYKTLGDSLISGNLPIIYALIAFWTGAGS